MPEPITLETYELDDILVVKLGGHLDADSAEEVESKLTAFIDSGTRKMIVDCAHLGYISSVGISALVTIQSRLRKRGGEVKLSALQGPVAEVIKIVRLSKLLDIHGDIEFARQSFAKA